MLTQSTESAGMSVSTTPILNFMPTIAHGRVFRDAQMAPGPKTQPWSACHNALLVLPIILHSIVLTFVLMNRNCMEIQPTWCVLDIVGQDSTVITRVICVSVQLNVAFLKTTFQTKSLVDV